MSFRRPPANSVLSKSPRRRSSSAGRSSSKPAPEVDAGEPRNIVAPAFERHHSRMTRLAFVLAIVFAATSGAQDPFARDTRAPLNVRLIDRMDSAKFTREKIVFDGRAGVRVPAFVATPKDGAVRHPLIVLVDGIGGWKERWWSPTSWNRGKILIDSLIAAGFAVAMADAPASGERTF